MELAKPKYKVGDMVRLVGEKSIKGQILMIYADMCYAGSSQVHYEVRLFKHTKDGKTFVCKEKFVEIELEPCPPKAETELQKEWLAKAIDFKAKERT